MAEDEDQNPPKDWVPINTPPEAKPVSGWIPIDIQLGQPSSAEIRMRDQLPPEYQEVLDELRADIPQAFRDKARQAAYYFWSLEENKKLIDENGNSLDQNVNRLADQLATTGFISWVYARTKYGLSNTDPQKSLPHWLTSRYEKLRTTNALTEKEIEEVEQFYENYASKHAKPVSSEGQTYHTYKEGTPPATDGVADNFKCYIENESLRNLQELEQTLNNLRAENLHPHDTKLFEGDRLVLYWHSQLSNDTSERVDSVFSKHGVSVRGPAQDPKQITIKEDGKYDKEIRTSSDASLGEAGKNPFKWEKAKYDKSEFFKQYLRLVFYGAKDPSDPYRIGFIPIIAENSEKHKELIDNLGRQLEQEELSSYTTRHYYIDPFE